MALAANCNVCTANRAGFARLPWRMDILASSAIDSTTSRCLRFSGVPGTARLSSIQEVRAAFDKGLSVAALIEECLERIASRNINLNAMLVVDSVGAIAAAHRADTELRRGQRRGPLHGIPVVIKDMVDVAGWPTTGGSRLFGGQVAKKDAAVVANLKAAGAIIFGKTNLHELTTGGHDNPWFGKVVNPLDASRGTGGTGSGSAAAVAAGFCVAAVGTDTAGSNRSPAAATGLVGFKPSHGLIDASGCLPTARSLDVIGSFTSTVADARLMTEAMTGSKAFADTARQPAGLVLATCTDLYAHAAVDPAVEQSHAAWFESLQRAGVRVVDLSYNGAEALREAGITILKYEFAEHYGELVRARPHLVGCNARAFVEAAMSVTRASYSRALEVRDDCKERFYPLMNGINALAVPTAPGLAPRLNDDLTSVGDAMVSYSGAGINFRLWANCLDMPSLALPLPCDGGLPASIQLAGPSGGDWALLELAQALETVSL